MGNNNKLKQNPKMQKSSSCKKSSASQKREHPIFNGQYEILARLGEGKTSKVYKAKDLNNPDRVVAIKMFKQEFIQAHEANIHYIE